EQTLPPLEPLNIYSCPSQLPYWHRNNARLDLARQTNTDRHSDGSHIQGDPGTAGDCTHPDAFDPQNLCNPDEHPPMPCHLFELPNPACASIYRLRLL